MSDDFDVITGPPAAPPKIKPAAPPAPEPRRAPTATKWPRSRNRRQAPNDRRVA